MNDSRISLYLDLCCLNRPFDDQSQARIHMEEMGLWTWIGSEALELEIAKAPDPETRFRLRLLSAACSDVIPLSPALMKRGETLQALGFKFYDALHLACAESATVEVLLTTDDRMVAAARRNVDAARVPVRNPVDWIREVM